MGQSINPNQVYHFKFELVIELDQEASEDIARSVVEDWKAQFGQWDYTNFSPTDWDEYDMPPSWFDVLDALPENYYAGYINHSDYDEVVAFGSYGPVLIYITMLDFGRGWADYPNILLQITMAYQAKNLQEMQFD